MRVQGPDRVGDKWSCFVVAERNPTRFIYGTGDTKEEALADLCEAICSEIGLPENGL